MRARYEKKVGWGNLWPTFLYWFFEWGQDNKTGWYAFCPAFLRMEFSLLHLMPAIARAHASTCATSLMCVKKKHVQLLFMTLIVWDIGTKKMQEITKTSNLIVDHFSLTIVNLSLGWILCFHVWHQNEGKFLVWCEYYNHFSIYQPSCVSLLVSQQGTLSNPEAYSELCQTSKMECFAKIANG